MSDYSQGKIYKIISSQCDDVYYGSCATPLNIRLNTHIGKYNMYLKGNQHYVTSFKIIEKGNYEIVLVEDYPCENEIELEMREAEYIKNNECVNRIVPRRTRQQWHEDNREKILKQLKDYNKANSEKIKQRRNEKIVCENCCSIVSRCNLMRHQRTSKCLNNCTHNAAN
jgi:hypothetical protein